MADVTVFSIRTADDVWFRVWPESVLSRKTQPVPPSWPEDSVKATTGSVSFPPQRQSRAPASTAESSNGEE